MANNIIEANDDVCIAPSPPQYEEETELETAHGQHDENDEGTIAKRLLRRRRQTAAVVAPAFLDTPSKPF
eukprot:5889813-Pleurochrysis_carterae.AAC.1